MREMMKKTLMFVMVVSMLLSSMVTGFAKGETQAYSIDEVIEALGDMLNYGVFTREITARCHMEATIAAKKALELGEYGFSSNNFNLLANTLTVNFDAADKNLSLVLLRNGEVYEVREVSGQGTEIFEKLPGGNYEAKLMENDEIVASEGDSEIYIPESYGNVSYFGELKGSRSVGMPVGPGIVYLNDKNSYELNKNYNARQGVKILYTEESIDFEKSLNIAEEVSIMLANAETGGSFKVYNLTPKELNSNDVVNNGFKSDGYEYILINIEVEKDKELIIQGNYKRDGQTLDANFSSNWENQAKMIYNVYKKDRGTIVPYTERIREQNPLTGILLAPKAEVHGAGNHGGVIISDTYHHTKGEVHQMRPDAEAFDGVIDVVVKKEEPKEEPEEEKVEEPEKEPEVIVPEEEKDEEDEKPEKPEKDESIHLGGETYAYIFGYEPVIKTVTDENGEEKVTAEVIMGMDDAVTVEQVSAMLMRMLDQAGNTMDAVYPVTPAVAPHRGQWYERGLAYLCSVGGFDPETPIRLEPITRGKVAKLVSCALNLNLSEETTFEDIEGNQYKEYIEKVYKYGYMHGQSEKSFAPDAIMTRAEFCNLFNNIIGRNEKGLIAIDENGDKYEVTPELYSIVDMDEDHWAYEVCLKATSAYDRKGYVDVETRTSNIRNILDQYDSQKLY